MTNQLVGFVINKVRLSGIRSIAIRFRPGLILAILITVPNLASAAHQDILINFTLGGNNVTSPDSYGHYWNNDSSTALNGGLSNMVTTNNASTTIGVVNVDVSGALGANNVGPGNSGPAVDPNRVGYFAVPNACSTFFYANSSTGSNSIAITGLTPGNNYNLRWYGARDATETRTSGYTLFAGNGTFTTNVTTSGTGLGGTGTNYTYVIPGFSRLTPTTNNTITFGFKTIAGSFSYVNVMEITVNWPPVAGTVTTNRNAGDAIMISAASLLAQSSDPDGDTLNFDGFSSLPAGATTNATSITLPGTNSVQTFTYTIDDGNGLTNSATVTVGINGISAGRRVVLIDLGPNDGSNGNATLNPDYLGQYWNNLIASGGGSIFLPAGSGLSNLITTNNAATGMGLVINNGNFQANGIVNGGLLTPSYSLLGNFAVTNATEDYIFTTQAAGASLSLTNLDPTATYRLRMFGTRNTDANTVRATEYIVTGGNGSFTRFLQTSGNNNWVNNGSTYYGNNNTIITVDGIVPDASKQIQINVNIAAGGFAYLGILEVTETKQIPSTTNPVMTRIAGLPVQIAKSSLATDASGDPLDFTISATTNGLTLTQDNDNIYVPANTVDDQFTFTVTDGYGGTNSGTVKILIGKVTPTIAVLPTASAINYGESLADSVLTGGIATNAAGGMAVDGTFAFTIPSLTPAAAGTTNVSVTFTPTDTANYNSVTAIVAVTVNGLTPTILVPPTASVISYGQTLASSTLTGGVATNVADGVAVPGSFVFTTPSLTPDAAGTIDVSATFLPSDPSYNSATTTVAVLVAKTTPGLVAPKSGPLAAGQTLASAILTGGSATNGFNNAPVPGSFAFTVPSIIPNLGLTNVSVTFMPTDTANYNSATTIMTVSVTKSIVVFGSSVALGVGSSPSVFYNGSYTNGYAGLLTALLTPAGWSVTNISIGGQTTGNGMSRYNADLAPLAPNFALIGYGLYNEGLVGNNDPAAIVNTFTTNLATIISMCRTNGLYPVTGLGYANNGFSPSEYQYVKNVNLAINSWNIPSANYLGALDDGSGHYVNGYWSDSIHPNNLGYREEFYTIVPSLFDAIVAGKTTSPQLASPARFARLTQDNVATAPITFAPDNTMHSFTVSFRVRSTDNGTIAAVQAGSNYATLEIRDDKVVYVSTNGQEIAISVNATNGGWHDVALAYRYALTNTTLYVDGVLAGNLSEQYVPTQFILGGPAGATGRPVAPAVVDFQNWCVYRSAWNKDEVVAQKRGNLQQASMEICATLDDDTFTSGSPATNRAQSLSAAMVNTANLNPVQGVLPPNNLMIQPTSSASAILSWTKNSTTESGFVVERRLAGSGPVWTDLVILPAGSTSFTDTALPSGVTYEYRIAALEGGLRSSYSNSAKFAAGTHQDILIDFGPNDDSNGNFVSSPDYLGQYWNTLYGPGGGSIYVATDSGLANLITTNNIATTVGLLINSNFQANGIVNGGLLTPSYTLLGNLAVTNATEDYIFTTSSTGAGLALTNLDPTAVYRLRMFGTRNTDVSTTRTTQYVVTGGNGSFTNLLQTSGNNGWANNGSTYYGNNNTIITVNGIVPDANKQIQLAVNVAAGGFAYLGIMEISANHLPVANDNIYGRSGLTGWGIAVNDLLTNATDVDFDPLTLVGVSNSTNGVTLTINGGYVTYYNTNLVDDRFSYTVTDGFGGTNTATITLTASGSGSVGGGISSVTFTNGVAGMTFTGVPGYLYHVQVSTNLLDWNDIWVTNAPSGGVFQFNDSIAPMPNAYYRLMWNGN
jgi:hypothetical protein